MHNDLSHDLDKGETVPRQPRQPRALETELDNLGKAYSRLEEKVQTLKALMKITLHRPDEAEIADEKKAEGEGPNQSELIQVIIGFQNQIQHLETTITQLIQTTDL